MVDYQLLREKITRLIVESAAMLDIIGTMPEDPHRSVYRATIEQATASYDRVLWAYKRFDYEWDRLVQENLKKEDRQ